MELLFSAGKEDRDLEATVQELAENILRSSVEYIEFETKSLEIAKRDLRLVKALADQLKSSQ
jgi:hypothetical protein